MKPDTQTQRGTNFRSRARLRLETLQAYGGQCACCGETYPSFLCLDHIFNDGAEQRRHHGTGAQRNLFGRLRREGWPQGHYQVLCNNCNIDKSRAKDNMCHCREPFLTVSQELAQLPRLVARYKTYIRI